MAHGLTGHKEEDILHGNLNSSMFLLGDDVLMSLGHVLFCRREKPLVVAFVVLRLCS